MRLAWAPGGQLGGKTVRMRFGRLRCWRPGRSRPLRSHDRLEVHVRAWGVDGEPSEWSNPYPVEAGLLNTGDWSSCFVTPGWDWRRRSALSPQPGPLLRKEFRAGPEVSRARLYVTALGVFEATINGAAVGDHVMDPGWTSYNRRLRYQTFDVTCLLRGRPNALGAMLGDGWYRGR